MKKNKEMLKNSIIIGAMVLFMTLQIGVNGQENVKTYGGTINFIPKWSNTTQIINSKIFEDTLGNVGFNINSTHANFQLHNPNADIINSGWTIFQLTNGGTGSSASDGLLFKIGANGYSKNALIMNTEIGEMTLGTNNLFRIKISNEGLVVIGKIF